MKFSTIYIVFITQILFFEALHTHGVAAPYCVADLTELELIATMQNEQPTVILGYMNHCPHCSKLLKTFETFPRKYQNINFFMVNGPEKKFHKKIADRSKFSIPGYPSIVFVKDGKITNVQIGGNEKTLEENVKKLR